MLGFDAAGTVCHVGDAVTLFQPGDEVYYASTTGPDLTAQVLDISAHGTVRRR